MLNLLHTHTIILFSFFSFFYDKFYFIGISLEPCESESKRLSQRTALTHQHLADEHGSFILCVLVNLTVYDNPYICSLTLC